jgi:hypothetical protein
MSDQQATSHTRREREGVQDESSSRSDLSFELDRRANASRLHDAQSKIQTGDARSVLMHTDNGGVDHLDSPIISSGERVYDTAPYTGPPPTSVENDPTLTSQSRASEAGF